LLLSSSMDVIDSRSASTVDSSLGTILAMVLRDGGRGRPLVARVRAMVTVQLNQSGADIHIKVKMV
jgi:hypothetical protein